MARRGFTLLEIVVAIGIISTVSAISIPSYQSMTSRVIANTVQQEVINALRKTQNLALTGGQATNYSFVANASSYTVDTTTYQLPQGASFSTGGTVTFTKLTGRPVAAVSLAITIRGQTRSITVTPGGTITSS